MMLQEAAQLPDSRVDPNFADELFGKVLGLPAGQQDAGYVPPHTKLQVTAGAAEHAHVTRVDACLLACLLACLHDYSAIGCASP